MTLTWPNKDPDEILDYQIDWSGRLGDDTIVTSTWIVPAGIIKDSDSHSDTTTTIWLSGGSITTKPLELTNRVVSLGGRTMDQTVKLSIKPK